MSAQRFIAIPTSSKSQFFGQRLECVSHNKTQAVVRIPHERGHTDVKISRKIVNVLADFGGDYTF